MQGSTFVGFMNEANERPDSVMKFPDPAASMAKSLEYDAVTSFLSYGVLP